MLTYVTTNEGKLREAAQYLGDLTDLDRSAYDYVEVQADDLETIAARGAADAYREVGGPVLVDDAGLFVDALGGFPGPYSAYVEERLGIARVQRLVAAEDDHRAAFRCVLAYAEGSEGPVTSEARSDGAAETTADGGRAESAATDGSSTGAGEDGPALVETFTGSVQGTVVEARGEGGFGYDPIFEHGGQTLAEMTTAEKNAISHRGRALAAFADWFAERTA